MGKLELVLNKILWEDSKSMLTATVLDNNIIKIHQLK